MNKQLLLLLIILSIISCKNEPKITSTNPTEDVVVKNIDTTTSPGDDFFQWANGGWFKKNPIPPSESTWGIGKVLQEDIYAKVRKISEAAAANTNATKGSNEQKIGDFWRMGMDTALLESQGIEPLRPDLIMIESISNIEDLWTVIAHLQSYFVEPVFRGQVNQDDKNSEKYAIYLVQGGLGLPDRDYYFNTDSRNVNIREEYKKHIGNMFRLMGVKADKSDEDAETVFKIEKFLAQSHRKIEALRDLHKNYNKMSVAEFQKLTPSVSWDKMTKELGLATVDSVVVGQPEFYTQMEESFKKYNIEEWKAYLKWHLVSTFAPYLSTAFDQEQFNFVGKLLEGRKVQKPRWKRVLDAQERALGESLGQLFVKEFFPAKAKKRYSDMVESIKEVYAESIQSLDWMSAETKAKAIEKLQKVKKKVGYPDKWKDFSSMDIDKSSYVQNVINSNKWWFRYTIQKLGKPVDRDEWVMTPQTYNAYYNPSNNEIVLPAAIFMIPGFEDADIDDAVVYGYGGASTIGHEITHGFDDQGRQYDTNGNLSAWWSVDDSLKFTQLATKLVQQFNEYVAVDTMHVRGEACLGENIADLGGVVLGLKAFMKTEQYKKGEKIGGYSPIQRYFMGYALGWKVNQTKEYLARQIMTDVHAPAKLRVNGPFVNIPEFYEAFAITDKHKMWRQPDKRVKIW